MHQKDLIGTREASSILGVDRGTLNRWAARGDVPVAYKVSGATGSNLFSRHDIEKFAQARAAAGDTLDFDAGDGAKQPA